MKVAESFRAVRAELGGAPAVLVPTMGFLHEGHLALVGLAQEAGDTVVMSLFVNPLQFDRPDDLDAYPRDIERDTAIAADAGVDVLFAPTPEEMYAGPPQTRVRVDGLSEGMEGAHRPGHFEGVATVVAKLFAGIRPAAAVFGRKDAQQLAVVRRMTVDLSFPIEILAAPTVRHSDGLAVSSRNVHLDDAGRAQATALSRGLFSAAAAAAAGERVADALESLVAEEIDSSGAQLEYVALADAAAVKPIERLDREAFLAVAAHVGGVRLIDNVVLWPDGKADLGSRLEGPSLLGRS